MSRPTSLFSAYITMFFLKPAGIFLILYISVTSATPTGQPGEAQNINDDIHARADYNPYLCKDPFIWSRRECLGAIDPLAWQDVCAQTPFETLVTTYQNQPGECEPGTTCLDTFNTEGRRFITCFSEDKGKGKRKVDAQAGMSDPKRARSQPGNTQFQFSVTIDHDMTSAAVAAVIKSNGGDFLIAPDNVLVGNVHGYQEEVCKGDKSNPSSPMARECYPNGSYNFKAGQIIDFTWGMALDQEGRLFYGIIPAEDD